MKTYAGFKNVHRSNLKKSNVLFQPLIRITYEEVKQIESFYKTSVGQKMANSFPIIIFQSLKDAALSTEKLKNSSVGK